MARYLRLYALFIAKNLRAKIEYRAEFWITFLGRLLEIALSFVFFWVTMLRVGHLAQWSLWQLGLILAVTSLVRSIAELLFTNVWALPDKIRKGELDSFLVKPINPLFHLIAERVEIQGLGLVVSGVAILLVCAANLRLHPSAWSALYFAVMIVCGGLLYLFLLLLCATATFWLIGVDTELMFIVVSFNDFARFPLTIFPGALRFLLTWLLPYAFTGFFPATFLMGMSDPSDSYWAVLPLTVGLGVAAYVFWLWGLRRYQSSGV